MLAIPATAKIYILDTNVLLHDADAIKKFKKNIVVLPAEVLVELDRKKTVEGQIGVNARRVHRLLREIFDSYTLTDENAAEGEIEAKLDNGGYLRFVITHQNRFSEKEQQHLDAVLIDRFESDHRILACAYHISKQTSSPVILVTKDANMALKAKLLGLAVQDYRNDRVQTMEFSAYREIEVDGNTFEQLQLYQWDTNNPEGFALEIPEEVYLNEYLIVKTIADGYQGMEEPVRYIGEGKVTPLPLYRQYLRQDVAKGDKNGLKMPGGIRVIPKNIEQWMHLDAVLNPDITLVTCIGKAGTGKTFIAMAVAMHEVLSEHNHYERLLISRPVVEMGKGIGYLPGTKEEKMAPYMQPYFDNLEVLFPLKMKNTKSKISPTHGQTSPMKPWERFQLQGILEMEALTFIRGRSIPNALLLVDEVQNLTPHEVKTVITRLAHGSKLVLMGDPDQIDNPFLDSQSNGLVYACSRLKGQKRAAHTMLVKGVRSEIAELGANLL